MKNIYINKNNVIGKVIKYESCESESGHTLNIAYGIDKNFLMGCGISIASILKNNVSQSFIFHIFIDQVIEEEFERLSQLAKKYKSCIYIYIVDDEALKLFPTTKNWSTAMYYRFVIGDYFANRLERIVYLDADIVCHGDITELLDIDLEGNVAGVVPERGQAWWQERAQRLHCPSISKGYFNSGFMLISVSEWMRENVTERALALLADENVSSKLTYMDQDILNLILVGNTLFLPPVYNTQFSLNYELKGHVEIPYNDNTIFIHYVGPTKPWHKWACYPSAQPFIDAKMSSPWKNVALMSPGNSNYARYCAKHSFRQNHSIAGIMYYIYYLYLKIKNTIEMRK